MNRNAFVVAILIGTAFLAGGCSSTRSSGYHQQVASAFDPSRPQTFLAGADVEQAKSIAMGSAASKGWEIISSQNNTLLVERRLDASVAQSLVGAPTSSASLEVTTEFVQRPGGVAVAVRTALVANQGTDAEQRIVITERYADELNRSLASLRRSWDENRGRVASAMPPLPSKTAVPAEEAFDVRAGAGAAEDERVAASAITPPPRERTTADAPRTTEPMAAPPVAPSSADDLAAPVEDRMVVTPSPQDLPGTAPPANQMLVLNRTPEPGVWSYYAEHYAKIRGCVLTDQGAVLEDKQPEYEIHRIYCENGRGFLVRCNAGTCRGLQ